ncbi:vacuolar ATPase [Daldinia loculata]|uniref:vacuolar ATPase n=1 Tax=Daldinia loculata TaxID=103429 RepID=UPI0020C24F0C|nr:vacuolar ATPase [Daldinia loculata]KAI1641756.1 vacuolar ATPase [Daldinia loculata]KAI2778520.1 vacuolar ATPase [Daldinia loculata]
MSAQNSTGIQTLLDAEREASKIVQKAREFRTKRVREARDEAKKEVEAYRRAKEEEFKRFEAEHTQGNKQAEDEANREADAKIKEIQAAGQKSQDKVVEDLLKAVFDVKPVPPERS